MTVALRTFSDAYSSVRHRSQLADEKLRALWDLVVGLDMPGDLAELGVFRGGTARLLAMACPDRAIHLYDTFTGIPWDGFDPSTDGHGPGEFAGGFDEVADYLGDCPNVRFHPGLFPGTAVDGRFALVHLDADLYASTKAGLEWFWPRLAIGGAIVLDDHQWRHCRGVDRAVAEYFRDDVEFSSLAPHQLIARKK